MFKPHTLQIEFNAKTGSNRGNEKIMINTVKCTYCGKSDKVEYLGGLDWFCNKRCHYRYRHMNDNP